MVNNEKGKLFLIPSLPGNTTIDKCIPEYNQFIINSLTHFIVEQQKSAFKILRNIGFTNSFDNVVFYELNEHTNLNDCDNYLNVIEKGINIGLLSEAGMPCIADPGEHIVYMAHKKNIKVVPLTGPSSILDAIISSGLNAEKFAFHGYLPIKDNQRIKTIKQLEKLSLELNQTQVFIETPYRNIKLFKSLIETCNPDTLISIATNIHCNDELIQMKPVYKWNSLPLPEIHKKPTVFCLKNNGNEFVVFE